MDWLRTLLSRCTAFFVEKKLDGDASLECNRRKPRLRTCRLL